MTSLLASFFVVSFILSKLLQNSNFFHKKQKREYGVAHAVFSKTTNIEIAA